MKKIISVIALACLPFIAVIAQQKTLLQEGTVVRVRLLETLDSKTAVVGDQINLEVSDDVRVGEKTVIMSGDKVTGTIILAEHAKGMGKKGKLDFTIDYVKSHSGRNVKVRSSTSTEGKSKTGGAVAAAVIVSPLFLLVKGKDVVVEKGKEFTTYVDKDYDIELK